MPDPHALSLLAESLIAIAAALKALDAAGPTPQIAERWIDAQRAAEISGMSRKFIYEHAHEIPGAVRRGRCLRIPEKRFMEWMSGRG